MSYSDLSQFSRLDMDALLMVADSSLRVHKRFQYFLWAQGGLNQFLPHETLVCAWGDVAGNRFQYEIFTQSSLHEQQVQQLADPVDGILHQLAADWRKQGAHPCLFNEKDHSAWATETCAKIRRYGFGHAMAHGAKEMTGDSSSFFLFLNPTHTPGAQDAHLLELLMPYLHMALHRMVAHESDAGGQTAVEAESVLSSRELEVLRWVRDGKTNHEIALILSISPLTVKNHVQKILRKLNATNRAQAVAKGIGSKLFHTADNLSTQG